MRALSVENRQLSPRFRPPKSSFEVDKCASIFIRTVHLICAFLGSILHVEHSPRCSDSGSRKVDNLSRQNTTGFLEKRMLVRWNHLVIPKVLSDWLNNPTEFGFGFGHPIRTSDSTYWNLYRTNWKIITLATPIQ